jgi:hypothetical protein
LKPFFSFALCVQVVADGVAGADLLDQYERGEIIMDSDGELPQMITHFTLSLQYISATTLSSSSLLCFIFEFALSPLTETTKPSRVTHIE